VDAFILFNAILTVVRNEKVKYSKIAIKRLESDQFYCEILFSILLFTSHIPVDIVVRYTSDDVLLVSG